MIIASAGIMMVIGLAVASAKSNVLEVKTHLLNNLSSAGVAAVRTMLAPSEYSPVPEPLFTVRAYLITGTSVTVTVAVSFLLLSPLAAAVITKFAAVSSSATVNTPDESIARSISDIQ